MFADLRFIDTIDVAENQIKQILPDAFKYIYLTKVIRTFTFSFLVRLKLLSTLIFNFCMYEYFKSFR